MSIRQIAALSSIAASTRPVNLTGIRSVTTLSVDPRFPAKDGASTSTPRNPRVSVRHTRGGLLIWDEFNERDGYPTPSPSAPPLQQRLGLDDVAAPTAGDMDSPIAPGKVGASIRTEVGICGRGVWASRVSRPFTSGCAGRPAYAYTCDRIMSALCEPDASPPSTYSALAAEYARSDPHEQDGATRIRCRSGSALVQGPDRFDDHVEHAHVARMRASHLRLSRARVASSSFL